MADRAFERLFTQAAVETEETFEREDPEHRKQKRQRTVEDQLRKMTDDMTAKDAIQRILLADKDRDYFRMLALPLPEVDALGRPTWNVTPIEVSKAYRKLSILVHPDKNPGDEARQAFEVLNKAHRLLKDAGGLETILKDHLSKAKARKEEEEARATVEERVVLIAQQQEEAKTLRKQEADALNAEIVRQMKEKQEKAMKKKEAEAASKYRRCKNIVDRNSGSDSDEEDAKKRALEAAQKTGDNSESDDEDAQRRRQALAKRRQQQLRKKPAL
ncbi:putative DnaJ-like protein subfamily C member 8 [Nannochloris sp. 'desiccata']|nr:putative DnaJ-like protein subfamily C member 8 [Chlorella desiccata (nom. nud.)]